MTKGPLRWLGVDVGWVSPAADSDGRVYEWTGRRAPSLPMAQAGPVTIRKADGTTIVRDPYTPREAALLLARNEPANRKAITKLIVSEAKRSGRGVALEDWGSFSRRKPAWVRMYQELATACEVAGVPVVHVNRAYTSTTCPVCKRKSRENRATRDSFKCVACGFSGHADVIAAMNIAARAEGRFEIAEDPCGNRACSEIGTWRAGLCRRCYRFRGRWGRLPTEQDFAVREEAGSLAEYRARMKRDALAGRYSPTDAALTARTRRAWLTHDYRGNPLDDEQVAAMLKEFPELGRSLP